MDADSRSSLYSFITLMGVFYDHIGSLDWSDEGARVIDVIVDWPFRMHMVLSHWDKLIGILS